ncbi:MAG TPA: hypothetical protein VFT22_07265 [Kofleriaceae bacterium]|nr:hypothetical protein [Kofleriaceae bacterium]
MTVERHVETFCLATEEQRSGFDAFPQDVKYDAMVELQKHCRALPKPWPDPVPPFGVDRPWEN